MISVQIPNKEIKQQKAIRKNKIVHSKQVFNDARELFYKNLEARNQQIPVIDETGKVIYFLKWEANQVEPVCYVKNFWHYDIDNPLIDYELLERGEVYLFLTLEEYTYQIASIIQKKYPLKYVFFMDANARLFFEETSYLHIISSLADLYNNYKNCISKTILTIDSKKEFLHNQMRFIIKRYRSLSVMTSLFWRCDVKSYGSKNPDKTFYVIKDSLGCSGLGDMIKRALTKVAMIQEKPGNIIPVIDFSAKGDRNQFTEGNGENAWTLYFEQICDVPLEEVYNSQNVIVSSHEGWDWYNPYTYEKHCFINWKLIFQKYLKMKDEVKRYVEKLYDEAIVNKEKKVLGVIGRGTDAHSTRGGMAAPLEMHKFLNEVEKALREWGCDSIFLATEDSQVYDAFMESDLHNVIQAVDQYRIDYSDEENIDLLLSEIKIRDKKNGYLDGLKYLGILYILSKCDSLISSCTCGASMCAVGLNGEKYENIRIF